MSWTAPPGAWGAADPLFLLLIALGIEGYLGGRALRFAWTGNPRRALAVLCLDLARRLNRHERTPAARRRRGALVAGSLALAALALGWVAGLITRHYPFAWTLELFLLVLLIDQRATWRLGAALQDALASGSLVRAREVLRPLTVEAAAEIDSLDRGGIIGAALAALGRRFAGRLMAPVVWYVALGLPGLLLQQTAYVMAATLSMGAVQKNSAGPGAGPYGDAARSLARAVAWPADALGVLLLSFAAAFVPGGRGAAGLRLAFRGGGADSVLYAALAAVGAPLRLNRALVVFAVACLINAGLIGALALLRLGV